MTSTSTSSTNVKASPRSPRVVVVGAGFAGVSTAAALREGGVEDVVILEAQQQPGGRVQNMELEDGYVESGAQFIHGEKGNYLYELAQKFGLLMDTSLYKPESKTADSTAEDYLGSIFFNSRGEKVQQERVVHRIRLINEIFRKYSSAAYTDVLNNSVRFTATFPEEDEHIMAATNHQNSFEVNGKSPWLLDVYDAMDRLGMKQKFSTFAELLQNIREKIVDRDEDYELANAILRWMVQYECADKGASPAEMSLGGYGKLLNLPGYSLTSSTSGLAEIFRTLVARSLSPHAIRLGKVVKAISWAADETLLNGNPPLAVLCEDGEEFRADHVIVTSSVAYLQKHEANLFRPLLPENYRHALHQMGFGIVEKIIVIWDDLNQVLDPDEDGIQFLWVDNDFPRLPSDKTTRKTRSGRNWYDILQSFERIPSHKGALLTWLTGEETNIVQALPEQEVRDVIHELLMHFTNNKKLPRPKQVIRTQWHSNPFILGAYSYIPAGMDLESHNLLSVPLPSNENPRLQISGEATSHRYFSTVHGAIDSGRKAARAILRHYNKN